MTRKNKPHNPPSRKKSGGGTLVGMFIGLVLGVAIAAVVVWFINGAPLPFNDQVKLPDLQQGMASVGQNKPGEPAQPLPLPGKPGDPAPEKRFEFYDILPGNSEAVQANPSQTDTPPPQDNMAATTPQDSMAAAASDEKSGTSKVPLFLQVGSFSTAQDADNQKAKLAFMGIEAVVQQVMIEDKTLYRVRAGPFTKIDELKSTRAELTKSGIESQLAK